MNVLGRKRGLFWIFYLFIKGISRGDPVYIGIAVVLVLGIIGYAMYQSHLKSTQSDTADYADQFERFGQDLDKKD